MHICMGIHIHIHRLCIRMVSVRIHNIHTKHQHQPLAQHQQISYHSIHICMGIHNMLCIRMVSVHIHNIHSKHQHQHQPLAQHQQISCHSSRHVGVHSRSRHGSRHGEHKSR